MSLKSIVSCLLLLGGLVGWSVAHADNVGCYPERQQITSPASNQTFTPGATIRFSGYATLDNPNASDGTPILSTAMGDYCMVVLGFTTDPRGRSGYSYPPVRGTLTTGSTARCQYDTTFSVPSASEVNNSALRSAMQSGETIYAFAYTMWMENCTGPATARCEARYGAGAVPPSGAFEANYCPASVPITINDPNRPPTAYLDPVAPTDLPEFTTGSQSIGTTIPQGTPVQLNGRGTDPDNDPISVYEWRIDGSSCTSGGTVVSTQNFSKSDLSVGPHIIYFSVIDSKGARSTNCPSVTLTIVENSCTPTNPGCAANTCTGQTCWNGCANIPGTKTCGGEDITLTVTKAGTVPGSVSSNPSGISSCTTVCTATYAQDTPVTLTASHGSNVVVEWGGCDAPSGDFCTVTMNASRSVTATFTCPAGFAWNSAQNECVTTANARTLTVYKEGIGSGMVSGSNIDCGAMCVAGYPEGEIVTLTSTPSGTSEFVGWGGACSGTQTTCTVTMDMDKTVTATYTCKPGYSWDPVTQQCATSYCGSATGGTYETFPADNTLCISGATPQNKQQGSTSYIWECAGADNTSACSATRQQGGAR